MRGARRLLAWAFRHPVLASIAAAMIVRAGSAVVILAASDGTLFLDDESYVRMAADMAAGRGGPVSDPGNYLFRSAGAFMGLLTVTFWAFGTHVLLGQMIVGVFGALTAGAAARVAGAIDPGCSLVAGLVVALLPSQVLFSSIVLKDALVWFALAGVAVCWAAARRGAQLPTWLTPLVVVLGLLAFLRLHTLVIACWAVVVVAVLSTRRAGWLAALSALAAAALVPLVFGLGVAGIDFALRGGSVCELRRGNAIGAASAVVSATDVCGRRSKQPAAGDGGGDRLSGLDLAYLPRGLAVMLLRPYPWDGGSTAVQLAKVENVVWYPLLVFAAIGTFRCRRRLGVVALPLLLVAGTLTAYALSEGNLGTAYRHRGEAVWAVAVLASAGVVRREPESVEEPE